MELNELTADERIALVALLELVVAADGDVSYEELAQIKRVMHAVGDRAYREAVKAADERFESDDVALAFITAVERPEARALIYETAIEAAVAHGVAGRESELLTQIQKRWRVPVRFEGPEGS
jgi:uncharacterized tellurite resistance protein B-like protein